ncbi:MAG: TOBE domain-containing protein [Deltaproteobacteria bacterium]|nr:TOBE domain-containing protein [Deltaproteobacteria bacterium]
MSRTKYPLEVSGTVWLGKGDDVLLGSDRIGLLEKIGECGSITKAARAAGISYKTAWDIVSAVNNLSEKPLVRRMTGGKGGGGTVLTEEGKDVVRRYRVLQKEHERFLGGLSEKIGDVETFYRFLRRIAVRVSARNTFLGKVAGIKKGAVSTEVTLSLKGGDTVVAVITKESAESLGLRKGADAYGIIKASSVLLGKDLHEAKISARNLLCGTVETLAEGPVNEEVTVKLSGGNILTSIITRESAKKLALKHGDHVCAVVKASSVILGVSG